MSDKEMNLAILNKLYEIAFAVWEKMAKVADYGSYTASEIANMLNKEFNFSNEQNKDEKVTVSVGTYTCSFPLKNIFYFVSVFEKLASVGRNARQFVFEESGELLGKATFVVSKGMSELCKFVADDELRPVMNYIILDAANNCLVASDGKKLLSFPAKVLEHSGDLSNFYISPKKFVLMCKKMKKGEIYNVTTKEKECATEEKTEQTNKHAKVVSLDKPSNKFSFDAIGVNVGDALTFIDGTKVIAAVPDDTPSEPINWKGKVFIDFKNKLAYKVAGYNTIKYPHYLYTEIRADGSFLWHGGAEKSEFEEMISHCMVIENTDENTIMDVIHTYLNDVPNEHQASEKCTERTITPLANENVSERKEMVSATKVVAISIGVPSCLDIPPNNMRLDIAANKPLNAAVGDCLCGVGKVVHTLPLPPPRSKRMSKITKVNQLIKKQKWKRIFVYLADLHSEMANAIDL